MIIDAKNLILGRLATIVAKAALNGEKVDVVNCDLAVITGKRLTTFAEYKHRRVDMGIPSKGPFIMRQPNRFVRRTIRGMLPYKQPRGTEALKRVMCHIGVPAEFAGKELKTFDNVNISRVPNLYHVSVGELCKYLGAKYE